MWDAQPHMEPIVERLVANCSRDFLLVYQQGMRLNKFQLAKV